MQFGTLAWLSNCLFSYLGCGNMWTVSHQRHYSARTCGSCGHQHHGYEHHDADLGHIQGLILGALLFLIVNMNMGGDDGGGGGGGVRAPPVRNFNMFRSLVDVLLFRGKRSLAEQEMQEPRVEEGLKFIYVSGRILD